MTTWFLDYSIFNDTSATHSHKHTVNLVITCKIVDSSVPLSSYSFPHFFLPRYSPSWITVGLPLSSCPSAYSAFHSTPYPADRTSFQHLKLNLIFLPQTCMNPNMHLWLPAPRDLSAARGNHTTDDGPDWCHYKYMVLSSPEPSTPPLNRTTFLWVTFSPSS